MFPEKTDEGVEIPVGFPEKTSEREGEVEFEARTGCIPHIVKHESHGNTFRTLLHPGGISRGSVFLQNWLGGKWQPRDKEGNEKTSAHFGTSSGR